MQRRFAVHTLAMTVALGLGALPVFASTLVVGSLVPTTAIVGATNTYTATFTDTYTVTGCDLIVDGSDQGSMTLFGSLTGVASASYLFTASGTHTAAVKCMDNYGQTVTGASVDITVSASSSTDVSAPSMPTDLQVTSSSDDNTPSFRWTASTDNEAVTNYDVSIDGGAYAAIGTATTYTASAQANGTHTFAVRARDAAGNVSGSASVSYVISASSNGSGSGSDNGGGVVSLQPPFGLSQMATDAMAIVSANRADLSLSTGRACEWATLDAESKVKAVFGAIADASVKAAIENFASCGTVSSFHLGAGERLGIVNSFKAAFGHLPSTTDDWDDVVKIGNGRFAAQTSASAEANARVTFKKIYLRDENVNVAADVNAVTIMAYGLRPLPRSLNAEAAAIITFRATYGRMPTSAQDWDAVRAVAYSGATR